MHDVLHGVITNEIARNKLNVTYCLLVWLGGLEIASVDLSTDDVLGLAPLHTTLVLPCHLHLGGDFALGLRL